MSAFSQASLPSPRPLAARLLYWVPTCMIVMVMFSGGLMDALQTPQAMEVFRLLGYPAYFAVLLGVAKVLGSLALVAPVPPTVREWAYAGLTFDVLSAIVSCLAVGKSAAELGFPFLALALLLTSYLTWRRRSFHAAFARSNTLVMA
ncbi:MAG: DoxX family protein [Myxococcales bacterium]